MSSANVVTILRILLTPLLIAVLFKAAGEGSYRYVAGTMLFFIGMSDWLDGYLARRRNETSVLGKYLDPTADKVLSLSLCIILASSIWPEPRVPIWLAGMIIFRDVCILVGSLLLYRKIAEWRPTAIKLGKTSNIVLLLMFAAVIMNNVVPHTIVIGLLGGVTVLTWVSGIVYLRMVCRFLTAGSSTLPTS
ncbi:MAG: CDP-alcohol phosphatidyltransferase family protein [Candidatus Brocadiales bacterium]